MEEFKRSLENGADVNLSNHLGFTPLMSSAKSGNIAFVKLLVKHGARLNTLDNKHFSALHYATAHNNIDVVKYLMENGAQISDKIYMTSILKNYKSITLYFDSLDSVKQIITQSGKNRK